MNTGIYCILHAASGKRYVGSAIAFDARWRLHRHHLRHNRHHTPQLQAAWNKHGEDAFIFLKLLICSKKDLLTYEQVFLDYFRTCYRRHGYNSVPASGSQLGRKRSEETIAKWRASRAGWVPSKDMVERSAAAHRGLRRSPESKARTSTAIKAWWARRKAT